MAEEHSWQPSATLAVLRRRAQLLSDIRDYFARTRALEVDTPTLARYGTTDPALDNFVIQHRDGAPRYLQTSPEFAMKRLLAAGSGDIFQICHAYRQEESSRLHQEEFTLLEWYRQGLDHHALMDDVAALLQHVGCSELPRRVPYAELFEAQVGLDPRRASNQELLHRAQALGATLDAHDLGDRALLLDFLFGLRVLPALPPDAIFIYDFPIEHAAYARIRQCAAPVAERFELVIGGVELANGFHEVIDMAEQAQRQQRENAQRQQRGLSTMAIDPMLLAALRHGVPPCAGVALGVDRLLMCLTSESAITQVIAFREG